MTIVMSYDELYDSFDLSARTFSKLTVSLVGYFRTKDRAKLREQNLAYLYPRAIVLSL
ncbi:hypothetical protein WN48_00365 [Eufriesea mexicana]|nr:hypothetical protein WN48_00365 [Eufriesea mexicana]